MNIAQHLDRAARHFPEKPAIIFEGRSLSYAALRDQVDRTARGLASLGVQPGQRVLLFLPNIPEFAIGYLGIQKLGGVAVSANVMLTPHELGYLLEDSGARVLLTAAALAASWQPLVGNPLPSGQVVVCEGEVDGFQSLARLTSAHAGPVKTREMDRHDPAAILYTSGTTGKQKGATLSHGNLVSNTLSAAHLQGVAPDDRLILFLPLFHVFGQNAIMNTAFAAGATVVLQRRFDPQETPAVIERDRASMFFAVPTIYIGLQNMGIDPLRLASIRYYFSAAATMPVEIANRWKVTYGKPIAEGYGLTETSPFASYNHVWEHRPGSVGTPIDNVEVKVCDPDDRDVDTGTWGEIVVRGPNIMLGYWNRPDETAQALRRGWFHTGDIGYMDQDGYVFLVDRVKDMINSAGFKVWPREVEEVLFTHPAIRECAVVGLPDELKGEIPAVYVVMREGKSMTAQDLDAFCRQKLAAYKVPRRVEFVDALPKSATGKVLKRVLRDQAAGAVVTA